MYTYTYMSHPPEGAYDFSSGRFLDGRLIASYNSDTKVNRPEVDWIRDIEFMWNRCTSPRERRHQWFEVNTDILVQKTNLSSSDNHVLQWIHGCKASKDSRGLWHFEEGVDLYMFNGVEFLELDSKSRRFVGLDAGGVGTVAARKWNLDYAMFAITSTFFQGRCMRNLMEMKSAEDALASRYTQHQPVACTTVVTRAPTVCLASGLYYPGEQHISPRSPLQ